MKRLGDLELSLLLDDYMRLSGNAVFAPAADSEWQQALGFGPGSTFKVPVSSLLIDDGETLTLLDAGFGPDEKPGRRITLAAALTEKGIRPEDIDCVVLTHAHPDHSMGCVKRAGDNWAPYYPNAEVVIQRIEYESIKETISSVWLERLACINEAGLLRLVDGCETINERLTAWPTPGHTPGHQSILIESEREQALYVGDAALSHRCFMREDWSPNWAWSREKDVASRKRVLDWAIDQGATMIFGHDLEMPFATVKRTENGLTFIPHEPVGQGGIR